MRRTRRILFLHTGTGRQAQDLDGHCYRILQARTNASENLLPGAFSKHGEIPGHVQRSPDFREIWRRSTTCVAACANSNCATADSAHSSGSCRTTNYGSPAPPTPGALPGTPSVRPAPSTPAPSKKASLIRKSMRCQTAGKTVRVFTRSVKPPAPPKPTGPRGGGPSREPERPATGIVN